MTRRVRRALRWVVAILRLSLLVLFLLAAYSRLRLKLWAWRVKNRRAFKRNLKGLPRGLAGRLYKEYSESIDTVRLPSLRVLAGAGKVDGGGPSAKRGRRRPKDRGRARLRV